MDEIVLGPIFSSQARSIIWVAMVCPRIRLTLGEARCMMEGKNPNMLEKWWGTKCGVDLSCLDVNEASSRAIKSPVNVTRRAVSLITGGIDITGVFVGRRFVVIRSPAIMLPQASRLIGLITDGLFSLIGERELKRG